MELHIIKFYLAIKAGFDVWRSSREEYYHMYFTLYTAGYIITT